MTILGSIGNIFVKFFHPLEISCALNQEDQISMAKEMSLSLTNFLFSICGGKKGIGITSLQHINLFYGYFI